MKYHNSFLIKDFNDAYILETSGKHWALKKVDGAASISNAYTLREDFEESNKDNIKNFKAEHQDKLFSFFSNGDIRQCYTNSVLMKKQASLSVIKDILRTHYKGSLKPIKGTKSVCMHSGSLIKSETTSSMIIDYIGDKFVVWFTCGPYPCVSAYKPLSFSCRGVVFHDIAKALEYGRSVAKSSKDMVGRYEHYLENIKPLRDGLEAKFEEIIYNDIENKSLEDLGESIDECMIVY